MSAIERGRLEGHCESVQRVCGQRRGDQEELLKQFAEGYPIMINIVIFKVIIILNYRGNYSCEWIVLLHFDDAAAAAQTE